MTLLLLSSACSGGQDEDAAEPPPIGGEEAGAEEPEPDLDGSDGDAAEGDEDSNEGPYAVPDEIDEAYAEDVINALLEIELEGVKIALAQEQGEHLAPEAIMRFDAIAAGERLESLIEVYQTYVDEPELADAYLPVEEMGTSRFDVDGILHAEPEHCMLVVGWWDLTETAVDPDPPHEQSLVSLSPVDRSEVEPEENPTPWQVRALSPMEAEGEPIPEDRWDDVDFGDELDRQCQDR